MTLGLYHHNASYSIGDRILTPEERVVVSTRDGPKEPRRIAKHLGVSELQPASLIEHKVWSDGEYIPTFLPKNCFSRGEFSRYRQNYATSDTSIHWGQGLKGRTVYIVDTLSNELSAQDLDKRIEMIAWSAKYNGAEAVVLIPYTLRHSAQERGVHQRDHSRMQTDEARMKYDGQSPLSQFQLMQYAVAGVDAIITPHNHCPKDTKRLCDEVNEELLPLHKRASEQNHTLRYNLDFIHVSLAPMLGCFMADYAEKNLAFDLSNDGANVLFLAPDAGAKDFVEKARHYSGLHRSAIAVMNKKRSEDGKVYMLELVHAQGLSEERGIEGMHVLLCDDAVRSGETMRRNIEALRGIKSDNLVRDPELNGKPTRVAVYATRTNFAGNSIRILSSSAIDDVIITNADPRGIRNVGELDLKTQMIWINFMLGEAAKAVEQGIDPMEILTPAYIRENDLLKIKIPHEHRSLADKTLRYSGVL